MCLSVSRLWFGLSSDPLRSTSTVSVLAPHSCLLMITLRNPLNDPLRDIFSNMLRYLCSDLISDLDLGSYLALLFPCSGICVLLLFQI